MFYKKNLIVICFILQKKIFMKYQPTKKCFKFYRIFQNLYQKLKNIQNV